MSAPVFDDRAPWDDDVADAAAEERTVTDPLPSGQDPWAGERAVADPPEESYDGHDDGDPLTAEEVHDLVGPVEQEAPSGSVAVTEDWLLAPPDRARELVDALRAGLLGRVRSLAAEGAAARVTAGRRPSSSDLLAEAQTMTRAYGLLNDLAALFGDLRKEAAATLTDAVQDHLGRKSAKVQTPDGGQVSISLAAGSSGISVDEEAVLDIIGSAVIGRTPPDYDVAPYAAGVRDGIAALRACLGASPGFTTTRLGQLVTDLQGRGEGALAARLEGSYARVERGEPTPKLSVEYGDGS